MALTVAVQRFGGDPVWRGRVVETGSRHLRLAIPWARAEFFDEAPRSGSRIGVAAARSQCGIALPRSGPRFARTAWRPQRQRFIQAAVSRDIPFSVLPNYIQLGWASTPNASTCPSTGRTSWIADTLARDKWNSNAPGPRGNHRSARLGGPQRGRRRVRGGQPGGLACGGRTTQPSTRSCGQWRDHGHPGSGTAASRLRQGGPVQYRGVIVEEHIAGDDHRPLVVNGEFGGGAAKSSGRQPVRAGRGRHRIRSSRQPGARRAGGAGGRPRHRQVDVLRPTSAALARGGGRGVRRAVNPTSARIGSPIRTGPQREVLDSVFGGRPSQIPTAAITGTNGKTTTSEMLFQHLDGRGKAHRRVHHRCGAHREPIAGDHRNLSGWPGARIIL